MEQKVKTNSKISHVQQFETIKNEVESDIEFSKYDKLNLESNKVKKENTIVEIDTKCNKSSEICGKHKEKSVFADVPSPEEFLRMNLKHGTFVKCECMKEKSFFDEDSDSEDVKTENMVVEVDPQQIDTTEYESSENNLLKTTFDPDLFPNRRQRKIIRCEICGKTFARNSVLTIHLRIHSGERPYHCDLCDKRFVQKTALESHRRLHTGEKPFVCDSCDMAFISSSSLTKHKKSHLDVKPYVCTLCSKDFVRKPQLLKHYQTHLREKPYKCQKCEVRFTHVRNLPRHMQLKHPD